MARKRMIDPQYKKKQIPSRIKYEILKRDGGICQYCGIILKIAYLPDGTPHLAYGYGKARFNFDHIIPEVLGGKTELDNLLLTCVSCNMAKGIKDKERFIALLKARGKIK